MTASENQSGGYPFPKMPEEVTGSDVEMVTDGVDQHQLAELQRRALLRETAQRVRSYIAEEAAREAPDHENEYVDSRVADAAGDAAGDGKFEEAAAVGVPTIAGPGNQDRTARVLDQEVPIGNLAEELATLEEAQIREATRELDAVAGRVDGSSPETLGENASSNSLEREYQYDDTNTFLSERLRRHEIIDSDGFKRDIYEINSRRVMFRNRDELPNLGDEKYALVDADIVAPTGLTRDGIRAGDLKAYGEKGVLPGDNEAITLVTNTPEGLLRAAIDAGFDGDGSKQHMVDEITQGIYSDESLHLVDSILAATQYDDEGRSETFEYEGYAVVLAALQGDMDAQHILDKKLALLGATEAKKRQQADLRRQEIDPSKEQAVDPHKLTLVHSTQYPIERNDDGSVRLRPSGALRDDKFPRATLHFTINGQVTSHIMGSWGNTNSMIVTNFAKAMEKNGTPTVLEPADTYFSLNPGESLSLPDAIVVRGNAEQAVLLNQSEQGDITYLARETYSEQQQREIMQLARKYGLNADSASIDVLREVALRNAESNLGAEAFATIGEWGSQDEGFDKSIRALRKVLGVGGAAHSMTPEGHLEHQVAGGPFKVGGQMREYTGAEGEGLDDYREHFGIRPDADIRAQRMVIAAGYAPTRLAYKGKAVGDFDFGSL